MVIRGLVGGGMLEPEEVNMFAHRRPDEPLAGLQVYAQGTFPVEVSKKGMKSKPAERVPLLAQVDPVSGEVRFYVDPKRIGDLR